MKTTRQLGAAVVLAMGVAAMAATAATAILVLQSTWARHGELTAQHAQAQALVQAGVDWARSVLSDDRRAGNVDHLGEPWALKLAPMPVDNGELAGHIVDQQAAFNVNNLVRDGKIDSTQVTHFRRLLALLGLPTALADTLGSWLATDSEPLKSSAPLNTSTFAVNPALADIAELALVPGFDDRVRARLRPYVSALPRPTAVNVNTASPEVLAAVFDGLSLDQARALVAQRERAYFRDMPDFLNRAPRNLALSGEGGSVGSAYFLVTLRATIGSAEARGFALLARGEPGWPTVVWRKLL